jgi:hypothetical protein
MKTINDAKNHTMAMENDVKYAHRPVLSIIMAFS